MLLRLHVQHELGQRPVQTRNRPAHHGKARPRQFGARVKIQPQRRAQVDMVLGGKAQRQRICAQAPLRRPAAQLHIGFFVGAHGHAGVRQVGHAGQDVLDLCLQRLQARLRRFQRLLDAAHLRHHGVGAGMVTLALEHADLLAQAVALRLQVFGAGLQHLALGLKGRKGIHIQPGLRVLAGLQTRHNAVQVFTQQGDVKHGVWVLC